MKKQLTDQALNEEIGQLPNEMTPDRELWSGIERAIQHKPQSKNKPKVVPLAWAASVIAAVLVSWMSFSPQQSTPGVLDTVALLQNSFESQKQTMLVSFGQPKLAELPPEMQEQLKQLASARQSIENALKNDPNNMELINLLRWTQNQELNLLEQLYTPKWQTI